MNNINIGNLLNRISEGAQRSLFSHGEIAQLTYSAFAAATQKIETSEESEITVTYPVGYRADQTTIQSSQRYSKNVLLDKHLHLANFLLPLNGLLQMVTTVEALLIDSIRTVVAKYPKKLGQKRAVSLQLVLESKSIEEIHVRATDELLNELSYKSPKEFAESFEQLLSINLLECPSYHKYIEIKATRDIHIHNRGQANDTYIRKAGTHARVASGQYLPVTVAYFLESFESCLRLNEWLVLAFHEHWHSSEHEDRKNAASTEQDLKVGNPQKQAKLSQPKQIKKPTAPSRVTKTKTPHT